LKDGGLRVARNLNMARWWLEEVGKMRWIHAVVGLDMDGSECYTPTSLCTLDS